MNYQKSIASGFLVALFVTGTVFFLGFLRAPLAHAADCGISAGDIAQITAIQNNTALGYSDEIKQELALRKQLVGETIACAQQEVQTFQIDLASTTVETDVQPLQSQMLGNLMETYNFYNAELTKLNVVGIAGTEAIAQEVLAWHDNTFLPQSENVNNFILWTQNQNLFDTAETRMAATQSAVAFLESASPNPALQSALNTAQASLATAESENAAAKTALTENLAPDQTLLLIKQSLGSLSDAYQGFSNASTIIDGILPQ